MSGRTYLAGLIGTGIGPSLTPRLHEQEAAAEGIGYVYRTLDLDALGLVPEDVGDLVRYAGLLGFDALNITHPCKQLVLPHLDHLDDVVEQVGATNTVIFRDGKTWACNTDVTGFAEAMRRGLPDASLDLVVQLGAGGAGAAVGHALARSGAQALRIVDPDASRAEALADRLAGQFADVAVTAAAPQDLPRLLGEATGLVHCTPTGMAEHPGAPLDLDLLHPGLWVADIVYRPLLTALVAGARERGCRVLDGGGMALHQAADTYALVTGHEPDRDRMGAHFARLASR
ncbi:shikimate dehydrogenase [Nocardioides mangrovicus]|uniref:Quinate/shikimate dehydrogenase (NAD(+)) n=1 Tax=Nocardioides mangrovicus TaxID=2478913 RepID=A0A3L8NZK2_9ACTN|nr:shikimate dehydrogenase [Nocardioides mangrovicus]RLV47729.1 shikimate dehydrogenase [Nocardioides mangrovicus]